MERVVVLADNITGTFFHSGFLLDVRQADGLVKTYPFHYGTIATIFISLDSEGLQVFAPAMKEKCVEFTGTRETVAKLHGLIKEGITAFMRDPYRQVTDALLERVELVPGEGTTFLQVRDDAMTNGGLQK